MSINSVDMLKKVSIENGYQPYAENDESVFYGFNIVKDSIEDKMNKALIYDKKQDMFMRIAQVDIIVSTTRMRLI